MSARALMFMGTGSDVGKSLIVTALCRAYARRGLKVMPFKPQNMSNNAAVTVDGGEIGRAQATQAQAANQKPVTAMNPILLKPEAERGAQLIVRGQRRGSYSARDYFALRAGLMGDVLAAFDELASDADLILVEGAGSASEVNLRATDIANFGFARALGVPVILIGDIGRGGVIASLIGTFAVIDPDDAALIVATLINRFQGDASLFIEGMALIAKRTSLPCLGPVPHFSGAWQLPAEDGLGLAERHQKRGGGFKIVVPRLPRIANFDDLDPLAAEPGVEIFIAEAGRALPRDADLIVLPGSKATLSDLDFLFAQGWDVDIKAHARAGGAVLGLCGGYQMLGRTLADPMGIEGRPRTIEGLGLLDVATVLGPAKQLRVEAAIAAKGGAALSGYHMHLGETEGPDRARPFAFEAGKPEGAISATGNVIGTYLHGIFAADQFRRMFLAGLGGEVDISLNYSAGIESCLEALADHLEASLDLDALLDLAALPKRQASA